MSRSFGNNKKRRFKQIIYSKSDLKNIKINKIKKIKLFQNKLIQNCIRNTSFQSNSKETLKYFVKNSFNQDPNQIKVMLNRSKKLSNEAKILSIIYLTIKRRI